MKLIIKRNEEKLNKKNPIQKNKINTISATDID